MIVDQNFDAKFYGNSMPKEICIFSYELFYKPSITAKYARVKCLRLTQHLTYKFTTERQSGPYRITNHVYVYAILATWVHVQYCQSDTGRESTSRPDKLLQIVIMLYGPSLFVSAVGGWVKRR